MAYNTTQHAPPPPSHSHTLSVYIVRLLWKGGEGCGGDQREGTGATVHKRGRKNTNMTDFISSLETLLNTSEDDI
jgi:hypothetical protein